MNCMRNCISLLFYNVLTCIQSVNVHCTKHNNSHFQIFIQNLNYFSTAMLTLNSPLLNPATTFVIAQKNSWVITLTNEQISKYCGKNSMYLEDLVRLLLYKNMKVIFINYLDTYGSNLDSFTLKTVFCVILNKHCTNHQQV